jgi:hypothetical protein
MAELADAPGTYRFEDGYEVRLAIEGGKLSVKFDDGGGCELVTTDRRTYFCEGDTFRIEFVRDAAGRVTGLTDNLEPARKIR